MATAFATNPNVLKRDAEQLMGTAAAPTGSSQITVGGTIYSFVPKKCNKVLMFVSTPGGGSTLTLKAGAYPGAHDSGEGDYTTGALGVSSLACITVDASRHLQADGSIQFSTSGACTVWAVEGSA